MLLIRQLLNGRLFHELSFTVFFLSWLFPIVLSHHVVEIFIHDALASQGLRLAAQERTTPDHRHVERVHLLLLLVSRVLHQKLLDLDRGLLRLA